MAVEVAMRTEAWQQYEDIRGGERGRAAARTFSSSSSSDGWLLNSLAVSRIDDDNGMAR